MTFSTVILAGGQSSRMGRDKAFVELDGKTLLTRQLATVRAAGAAEIILSGRADTDYSAFGLRVVHDALPGAGPLAGIHAALLAASHPLLLVLAIDLPAMDTTFLRKLLNASVAGCGIIPRIAGQIEPLAALYPRPAHELADAMLVRKSFAVRDFASACVASGRAAFADFPAEAARWFKNVNHPTDLPPEIRVHS